MHIIVGLLSMEMEVLFQLIVSVWLGKFTVYITMERFTSSCFFSRLGEACSHVAAVLFKIEYAVRNGYTTVTSQTCSWNRTFSKHVRIV